MCIIFLPLVLLGIKKGLRLNKSGGGDMAHSARKYLIMSFGLGGNGAKGIAGKNWFDSSWYIGPDQLQRHIDSGNYPSAEIEGCILIDKCQVLEDRPGLAFSSPMCNLQLKDGETDRLFDRDYIKDELVLSLLREFAKCGWGAVIASGSVGGLDYVSPAAYVAWWQDKGAKIGQVINGKVTWF